MFAAARFFGIAAFAFCVLPVLALAEPGPSARSGRAWTDPPARDAGAAGGAPAAEAPEASKFPKAPEASKPAQVGRQATVPPPAASRVPRAAIRAAKAPVAHPVTRPAAPARTASRPVAPRERIAAAPRPRGHDSAFRVVTMRPPYRAVPPSVRYGYVVAPVPARPLTYDEARIARIRQAEAAGYLVVRSRSLEFPDGRRLRTYRPYEDEADD